MALCLLSFVFFSHNHKCSMFCHLSIMCLFKLSEQSFFRAFSFFFLFNLPIGSLYHKKHLKQIYFPFNISLFSCDSICVCCRAFRSYAKKTLTQYTINTVRIKFFFKDFAKNSRGKNSCSHSSTFKLSLSRI
jgi:hypothetical protein